MKIFALSKKEVKQHSIIWIIIICLIKILDPIPGNITVNLVSGFITFSSYILLYYILALKVFPNLFLKKIILFITEGILVFIIFFIIKYTNANYIIPKLNGVSNLFGKPMLQQFSSALLQLFEIGSCAYVLYLNKIIIYKLNQQSLKKNALIKQELNFLKGQFNTHLTFNFLNFCYGQLNRYSKNAANIIEVFSEMLEYSLRTKVDEFAPLEKEVEYIENFITLQKAISTESYVIFNSNLQIRNQFILSRILVAFLENAFLHGQINQKEFPIEVNLKVTMHNLDFSVKYKVDNNTTKTDLHENNLKQILKLYYKCKHLFNINCNNGIICNELNIKL